MANMNDMAVKVLITIPHTIKRPLFFYSLLNVYVT